MCEMPYISTITQENLFAIFSDKRQIPVKSFSLKGGRWGRSARQGSTNSWHVPKVLEQWLTFSKDILNAPGLFKESNKAKLLVKGYN
jgi:hypothetical protein